ncbi:hypothetical protein KP509_34G042100 [Ceratopteris richardii]|uniref:BED-type domain-containing protein n=1 Tax=Ceratopteris richardii TaxID=49495 RepID=A0A8T2QL78_CERRI|nr:hypothetical protein KP509_34G042100 [Ceratopteris richardii]
MSKRGQEWDYVDKVKTLTKGQHRCKCKFCDHVWDGGANRMRAHILGLRGYGISKCDKVPEEVKVVCKKLQRKSTEDLVMYGFMASQCENETHGIDEQNDVYAFGLGESSGGNPSKRKTESVGALLKAWDSKVCVDVDIALHMFFFAEDIPFWKVRSPYLQDFVNLVGRAGPSYKVPSYNRLHKGNL